MGGGEREVRWDESRARAAILGRWQRLGQGRVPPVTRFAPSPTGYLHAGHVEHLHWLCGVAELLELKVIVRIEDHDRHRSTREFERVILEDLAELGFPTDPVSLNSLRGPAPSPYRQSDHPERYQAAFEDLRARGLLYGCTCTRGDLPPPGPDGERRYPGTCRGQPIDREGRTSVRLKLPEREVLFEDLLTGIVTQHPARDQGDLVIRDADGQWTYQFSVVVDDLHDDIGVIIRGDDLLASTGRQWLVAELLGRTAPPLTLHHPLVVDDAGRKLSKRDNAPMWRKAPLRTADGRLLDSP